MAVFWQSFGGVQINLDQPVYTVDLVNISPGPPPGPVAPGPAIPATSPNPAPPTMEPKPEVKPEQAAAVPEPKPAPKPEPAKPEPVKPEPVKTPPPKPEPVKPEPPKPAKPEAKPISETKVESKKPEPAKKQPEKQPSPQDILASALKDVRKEASTEGKGTSDKPSQTPAQQAQSALQNELAALRKSVGGSLYSTGGGGGGGGGGTGGGSGLLQVYASIVEQTIKKNWRYPVFGNDTNLVAVIEVRIDSQGHISDARVVTPSARADFDDSAIKAVRETKELPPPPTEAVGTLRINFNLQELNH